MEPNRRKGEKEMRQLEIGEEVELPDGRTVKFVECNIESMDDPCEGCAFEDEHCTSLNDYLGSCGSGRTDGKFGIFIECNN